MGLFSIFKKSPEEQEQEYYKDLYELYHGEKPKGSLTEDQMDELEMYEEMEWEEDEEE